MGVRKSASLYSLCVPVSVHCVFLCTGLSVVVGIRESVFCVCCVGVKGGKGDKLYGKRLYVFLVLLNVDTATTFIYSQVPWWYCQCCA